MRLPLFYQPPELSYGCANSGNEASRIEVGTALHVVRFTPRGGSTTAFASDQDPVLQIRSQIYYGHHFRSSPLSTLLVFETMYHDTIASSPYLPLDLKKIHSQVMGISPATPLMFVCLLPLAEIPLRSLRTPFRFSQSDASSQRVSRSAPHLLGSE